MRTVFLKVWAKEPSLALAPVAGWSPHGKTNNMLSCEIAFDLFSEVRGLNKLPTEAGREP